MGPGNGGQVRVYRLVFAQRRRQRGTLWITRMTRRRPGRYHRRGSPSGDRFPESPRRKVSCVDQGNLHREPEGWRREDDDVDQPWRCPCRAGLPRPVHRHGPAGQPDRRIGHLPVRRAAVDGRRPGRGARAARRDRATDRDAGPGRGAGDPGAGIHRGRAVHRHRARDGAARRTERLGGAPVRRGHPRLPADARPAHNQLPCRQLARDHPGTDPVLRHQGPDGADQGDQHHQAQAEPRPRDPGTAGHLL